MRRYSLKLRLIISVMLMAFIFPGFTYNYKEYEYDKDFGFGEIDKEQYVYDLQENMEMIRRITRNYLIS